jgi:sterol desaturase/sphingolipid hydroxylase (fatty acid hydroxylase superfamily)
MMIPYVHPKSSPKKHGSRAQSRLCRLQVDADIGFIGSYRQRGEYSLDTVHTSTQNSVMSTNASVASVLGGDTAHHHQYQFQGDSWTTFVTNSSLSERHIFAISLFLSHFLSFWILNGLLFLAYRFNWFKAQRIQGNKEASPELTRECLIHNVVNHLIVQPLSIYFAYDMFTYCGTKVNAPVPSALTFLTHFAVFIAANDTLFYWVHRGLHHKSIYKYIHKKHHNFKVNIGIASEFAHPIEDIFANVLPTFAGCLLMGSHTLIICAWLVIRIAETVDAHSGFNFRFSPFSFLPWQGGADRHDYHHSHNVGCFGSFFIFWDWAMGI